MPWADVTLPFTVIIPGNPRTKKNSQRIWRHGKRMIVVPSAQYRSWEECAVVFLLRAAPVPPHWAEPLNLTALIYRDRKVGDLGNYLNAVCDALEAAGIVENDKFILGFDGSRLRSDPAAPRIVLTLSALEEE